MNVCIRKAVVEKTEMKHWKKLTDLYVLLFFKNRLQTSFWDRLTERIANTTGSAFCFWEVNRSPLVPVYILEILAFL